MNLYETEALTFDPESRRGESTAADVFFFFLFVFSSLPVWVDKCAWCLFYGESILWKKKNKRGEETSGCSALSISCLNPWKLFYTRKGLHMNTLIGTRKGVGEKGEKAAIISCQAAFQEMVNVWDHNASLSWTRFITRWRTIQPILSTTCLCLVSLLH